MSDAITLARPATPIGDGASTIGATPSIAAIPSDGDDQGLPFAGLLRQALVDANQSANQANHMAADFAAGKNDDIHGTMIASKQAEIELHLVASVKNKVVDAINDLLRMSI
jgi:flagellar hook-basal body complex protein FliE